MINVAYRSLDAAMQAAKQMAEEVKQDIQDIYDDMGDDVVITVDDQLVYFTIKGQPSDEQWQVREIELID